MTQVGQGGTFFYLHLHWINQHLSDSSALLSSLAFSINCAHSAIYAAPKSSSSHLVVNFNNKELICNWLKRDSLLLLCTYNAHWAVKKCGRLNSQRQSLAWMRRMNIACAVLPLLACWHIGESVYAVITAQLASHCSLSLSLIIYETNYAVAWQRGRPHKRRAKPAMCVVNIVTFSLVADRSTWTLTPSKVGEGKRKLQLTRFIWRCWLPSKLSGGGHFSSFATQPVHSFWHSCKTSTGEQEDEDEGIECGQQCVCPVIKLHVRVLFCLLQRLPMIVLSDGTNDWHSTSLDVCQGE